MTHAVTAAREADARRLFALMLGIFLGGGLLASVEALLVPRLKVTLDLDYAEAMAVQLVYYAGYLAFAVPATILVTRAGAMRATAAGLAMMAVGCALVAAALASQAFAAMLAALLLVSSGVTLLQIACNGLMATHGDQGRATARFTALQGFNSIGTVLGPLLGAWFLLARGDEVAPLLPFLAFAAGFAALGLKAYRARGLLPHRRDDAAPRAARILALLREPRIRRGVLAIFAYVGAEVTVGTLLVIYLMQPERGGIGAVAAGRLASLYWCGAMVGRFAGSWVMRRVSPTALLVAASLLAAALVLVAACPSGRLGGLALLAVGLGNSVMFPIIFALAMPPRAEDVPAASMLLCMAVVGGAVVPFVTGLAADRTNLSASLAVPALCYGLIWRYARLSSRSGASPA